MLSEHNFTRRNSDVGVANRDAAVVWPVGISDCVLSSGKTFNFTAI
jgi:hypothetical protein